jgi:oligopeptide/dipeptide ABC transporter ATP-binding protein
MEVSVANQDRVKLSHLSRCGHGDLLQVRNLSVNICQGSVREARILQQVSFNVAAGEIVGLLGESGCGKTTTALALIGLLPHAARVVAGTIEFGRHNLLDMGAHELRHIRGSEISIVFQDSEMLNPVMRVGDQVVEVLRAHTKLSSEQMRKETYAILKALHFEDCDRIFRSYPHQLSGGQRRRIAIAQAVACRPRLVIADEPTSSLDPRTTREILSAFSHLRDAYETAFLLISHDPETLMSADRALVMYAGQIVEGGPLNEVFEHPQHPYTRALSQCGTSSHAALKITTGRRRLPCIPGQAPDPSEETSGCSFSARCADRMESCDARQPELIEIQARRSVRCLKFEDMI